MEEIIVLKKDGSKQKFNRTKIEEAVLAAAKQVLEIGEDDRAMAANIASSIELSLGYGEIATSDLHEIVQHELMKQWPVVYEAYAVYRNYKKNLAKSYKEIHSEAEGVLYAGDKENANKDSRLNSTKQALIGGLTMKEFVKQYELSPKWVEAHEEGFIHIHDMAERYLRSQNCFSVETAFITEKGVLSFKDFSDGEQIKVLTAQGNWKNAIVKNFGKKTLNKYILKRGTSTKREVFATSNHRWILKDGTETTNLKVGDKLLSEPKQSFDINNMTDKELLAWIQGFIYGDGCITNKNNETRKNGISLRFCGEKKKYIPFFEKAGFEVSYPDFVNNEGYICSTKLPKKEFLETTDPLLTTAFVEGYLAADGAFSNGNLDRKTRLQKTENSIDSEEFDKIRKYFPVAGYFITREDILTGQETNFTNSRKPTINFTFAYGNHITWKVVGVEENVKEEDVWCLIVEEDKSFVLDGGIPTGNCCLFNMGNLLKGGFSLNGAEYLEPKSVQAALAVIGDITLSASAQQYGGFTIPEIDTVLAKYAELSYKTNLKFCEENVQGILPDASELMEDMAYKMTIREIEQGIQGFETKLNTVSNSLGQVPFVTVTFGLDTSTWGREIAKNLIKVREKGMGQKKTTAVFPKLVFLHRAEVNGNPGSPNFDIKQEAIQCSRTRLYPDYLSLDSGHLAEVYNRTGGKAVSPMG